MKKKLKTIPNDDFPKYKQILDILSDELALYIERIFEENECVIKFKKQENISICSGQEKSLIKFYSAPRIKVWIAKAEYKKLLNYFKTEVFSKLETESIDLEIFQN
jgi:hypothetical protein